MATSIKRTYGIQDTDSRGVQPTGAGVSTSDMASQYAAAADNLGTNYSFEQTQAPSMALPPSQLKDPGFSYNLDNDALYQMYRDRYTQNAKRAMQDTMGQAASLTGGYGSTYGQAVGQQAYDETMRGLTDKIPELQQNAYGMWKDNKALEQQQYSNLSALIMRSGYQPTEEELAAAGMSAEQANAFRQAWIAANPGAAYMSGALSADNYLKLTGKAAPGTDVGGGGGGGSRGGSSKDTEDDKSTTEGAKKPTRGEVDRAARAAYQAGEITYDEYATIMSRIH